MIFHSSESETRRNAVSLRVLLRVLPDVLLGCILAENFD